MVRGLKGFVKSGVESGGRPRPSSRGTRGSRVTNDGGLPLLEATGSGGLVDDGV